MKKKITSKQAEEILNDPFYKLESNIKKMFFEQDERAKEYRDQILTKMDKVMGELENHRIEQMILRKTSKI